MSNSKDNSTPVWRQKAACRGVDPEVFFPAGTKVRVAFHTEHAKAICGSCPVRAPCLDYALATGQRDGIWGGMTAEEREEQHAAVL